MIRSSPMVKREKSGTTLVRRYPLLAAGLVTGPIGRLLSCFVGYELGYLYSNVFQIVSVFGAGYVLTLFLVPFSKEATFIPLRFAIGSTALSFLIVLGVNLIALLLSNGHSNLYPYRFWYDPLLTAITCGTSASLYCLWRSFANRAH